MVLRLWSVTFRVIWPLPAVSVPCPCGKWPHRDSKRNLPFVRLQRDQRLHLRYIGKRKQGFLRNHAIPQCTFLTPVGNRCITLCVCVKEPSRSRGVIPTAGGLYVLQ